MSTKEKREENLRKNAITEGKVDLNERQRAIRMTCNAFYGFKPPGFIQDDPVFK